MAASDHLNGQQLKMFMSPNEIDAAGYTPTEDQPLRKTREAKAWGLTESIKNGGVQYPVTLGHTYSERTEVKDRSTGVWRTQHAEPVEEKHLINGHHRYFAQKEVDPDRLMPVQHGEEAHTVLRQSLQVEARSQLEAPELPSQYQDKPNYPAAGKSRTGNVTTSPSRGMYGGRKHSSGWDVGGMA